MNMQEELYSNIPPSKKRASKVPFIKTDFSPFWTTFFDCFFKSLIKKTFSSIKVKNAENFDLRDKNLGTIFYASHFCWWDGIMAYYLTRKILNTKMHMMIEELHRFPLLAKIGGFSVDKSSPQSAITSLNYCREILKDPSKSLWIFPQGIVKPPDYRPIEFEGGLAYLCKKAKNLNVIPIAHRYTFLREDKPEALIEVGKPTVLKNADFDKNELSANFEDNLAQMLENQRLCVSNGLVDDYKTSYKSELIFLKKIEKFVRAQKV